MLKVLTQDSWPGMTLHTAVVCTDDQDGRVVKALDLRSNGQMSSWVRTPLLVEALVHSELSGVSMRFNFRTDLIQTVKIVTPFQNATLPYPFHFVFINIVDFLL